jgi:hypothetical protein
MTPDELKNLRAGDVVDLVTEGPRTLVAVFHMEGGVVVGEICVKWGHEWADHQLTVADHLLAKADDHESLRASRRSMAYHDKHYLKVRDEDYEA